LTRDDSLHILFKTAGMLPRSTRMTVTAEAIIEIVAAESGLAREKLQPEATLAELDISSLDLASIAFEIEDRFNIEVAPEEISRELSLGGLVDHIAAIKPR
jgi:acyl carrier protein